MSKPSVLTLDTLDDRREIWHLLHRLHPQQRVAFLSWCCEWVRKKDRYGNGPVPHGHGEMLKASIRGDDGQDQRLTTTIYTEIGILGHQQGLDMKIAATRLEKLARGRISASA